jgi:hypothetical protein
MSFFTTAVAIDAVYSASWAGPGGILWAFRDFFQLYRAFSRAIERRAGFRSRTFSLLPFPPAFSFGLSHDESPRRRQDLAQGS